MNYVEVEVVAAVVRYIVVVLYIADVAVVDVVFLYNVDVQNIVVVAVVIYFAGSVIQYILVVFEIFFDLNEFLFFQLSFVLLIAIAQNYERKTNKIRL